jgi:hypothetical protein
LGLALVSSFRPELPLYWDELVWLAKARVAAGGWDALRARALDPAGDVIPAGYPLLYPSAAAWLVAFRGDRVTSGAAAFELVIAWTFVAVLATHRKRLAPLALGLLAATPLVWVHVRAVYADLPVGLLAATLALLVAARRAGAASLVAMVLAGLKDEGVAHVVAVVAATCAVRARRREPPGRVPALVLAAALATFLTWRALLYFGGVSARDHAFGVPAMSAVPALAGMLAAHLGDLLSWGALWALVAGASLALARPGRRYGLSSMLAAVLAAQSLVLAAAIVCGPEQVRSFALSGTLVGRLLIQLAPMGGLLVASVADETVSDMAP